MQTKSKQCSPAVASNAAILSALRELVETIYARPDMQRLLGFQEIAQIERAVALIRKAESATHIHMNVTSTLYLDENGQPLISAWMDWIPTCELRFRAHMELDSRNPVSTGSLPTRVAKTLQQKWTRRGISSVGHVAAEEEEWRDVPLVFDAAHIKTEGERDGHVFYPSPEGWPAYWICEKCGYKVLVPDEGAATDEK